MFWSCGFSGFGKLENPENGRFVGMAHGKVAVKSMEITGLSPCNYRLLATWRSHSASRATTALERCNHTAA
jgi:hypothetical protein